MKLPIKPMTLSALPPEPLPTVPPGALLYALQHLHTKQFIAALEDGIDYLICFTNGDAAYNMRTDMGLIEFVDIVSIPAGEGWDHFYIDGEFAVLRQ
jgi:hypothetical protein